MAKYQWEGRSRNGSSQKGVMEAPNQAVVEAQLKRYGFSAVTIKEHGKGL